MKQHYRLTKVLDTLGYEYIFLLLDRNFSIFCSTEANTGPGWFSPAMGPSLSLPHTHAVPLLIGGYKETANEHVSPSVLLHAAPCKPLPTLPTWKE